MPALSPTMTSGNIAKWMVSVGSKVSPGDHLCDIETDKATIGWEAQEEGYVAKLLVEDGATDIPIGKIVLVICDDEKDVAAFANYTPTASSPSPPKPAAAAAPAAPAPPPPAAAPAAAAAAAASPAAPAASASVAAAGGSVVAQLKGKKWAFAKEFGLHSPQNTYY